MKASKIITLAVGFLTIALAAPVKAQDYGSGALTVSVQRLLAETQKQGLILTKSYANAQAALNQLEISERGAEAQKQATDLILRISSDFATGQVKADRLKRDSMIPLKKLTKNQTDTIALYTNGLITVEQLIQVLQPKNGYYGQLLTVLNRFQDVLASGQLPQAPAKLAPIKKGVTDAASILYARARLALLGYNSDQTNPQLTSDLTEAIKAYQADHNLDSDGVLGPNSWIGLNQDLNALITKVRINLDRTRWLPDDLGVNHVFVNLAQQKLRLIQNSQLSMTFKTINGRIDRETPMLFDSMSYLMLNPTWTVPQSILLKDKVPLLIQNPQKLYDMNMKVFNDVTNEEVDAFSIDWAQVTETYNPYTIVQSPGAHNALGFVKFPLTNPYAIYLHDTDSRALFKNSERLLSSGCVRLEKPFEFAEKVLNNEWTAESLRSATEFLVPAASASTRVRIKAKLPVYLFYLTTSVSDEGKFISSKDAYKIDAEMYGILAK